MERHVYETTSLANDKTTGKPDERRRDVNAFVNVKNWRIEKRYSLLD
jgi:hypothetical protein